MVKLDCIFCLHYRVLILAGVNRLKHPTREELFDIEHRLPIFRTMSFEKSYSFSYPFENYGIDRSFTVDELLFRVCGIWWRACVNVTIGKKKLPAMNWAVL